jgi:hypothetical protein
MSPGTKKRGTAAFWIVFLLCLVILITVSIAVQVNISMKFTRSTDLSVQDGWQLLTDMGHQIFWRTNLINITRKTAGKDDAWKEIFSGDHERIFRILERVEGEKLVKAYEADENGQENLTLIVLPDRTGSQIALIDTIRIINPVQKFALMFQPSRKADHFKKFNGLVAMFTNGLMKQKSGDSRPLSPAVRSGTN